MPECHLPANCRRDGFGCMSFQIEHNLHDDAHNETADDVDDQRSPWKAFAENSGRPEACSIASDRTERAANGHKNQVCHKKFLRFSIAKCTTQNSECRKARLFLNSAF